MEGGTQSSSAGTILALDVASRLGWAYGAPGQTPESGSVLLAPPGSSIERVAEGALNWATARFRYSAHIPYAIVVEEVIPATAKTTMEALEATIGIPVVIKAVARGAGVARFYKSPLSSVRKHFLGHGGLSSLVAKRKAAEKCLALGWIEAGQVRDYDRCDALAVWSYACAALAPREAQPVDPLFVHANTAQEARRAEGPTGTNRKGG